MMNKNLMTNYKTNLFYILTKRISSTANNGKFFQNYSVDPTEIKYFNNEKTGLHIFNKLRFNCINRAFSTTTNIQNNSSIDSNEINHFNSLDSIWWDKEGQVKGLHTLNKLRVPFIEQCLLERGLLKPENMNTSTPLKGINILDSGCGGGILSEALATMGANITGVDITPNLIKVAKEHANKNPDLKGKINYICSPLEDISHLFKDKFDAVISSEILDHVGSKEIYLKSLVDVLRPDGSLILSTINQTLRAWYIYILYGEFISRRLPFGCHHWKKLVRPEIVRQILADHNCEIIKTRGYTSALGYTSKFNEFYWSDDFNVHYIIHAIKK